LQRLKQLKERVAQLEHVELDNKKLHKENLALTSRIIKNIETLKTAETVLSHHQKMKIAPLKLKVFEKRQIVKLVGKKVMKEAH